MCEIVNVLRNALDYPLSTKSLSCRIINEKLIGLFIDPHFNIESPTLTIPVSNKYFNLSQNSLRNETTAI